MCLHFPTNICPRRRYHNALLEANEEGRIATMLACCTSHEHILPFLQKNSCDNIMPKSAEPTLPLQRIKKATCSLLLIPRQIFWRVVSYFPRQLVWRRSTEYIPLQSFTCKGSPARNIKKAEIPLQRIKKRGTNLKSWKLVNWYVVLFCAKSAGAYHPTFCAN